MNLTVGIGRTKIIFFAQDNQGHSKFSIPTTNPDDFKKHVAEDFKGKLIDQIILGCFGPLSLSKNNYGEILNTPKKIGEIFLNS